MNDTTVQAHVLAHPIVATELAVLRDPASGPGDFRRSMRSLARVLAVVATESLPTTDSMVTTALGAVAPARRLASVPLLVPILRAGLGLVDGFLDIIEDAIVGHVGMYRDPHTLEAVSYYTNLPEEIGASPVFVLDPMLATGHTALAALERLRARGANEVTLVCVIAAPEGVAAVHTASPTTRIIAAALDERLDAHGYIVPGLGDAGDRLYGTAP